MKRFLFLFIVLFSFPLVVSADNLTNYIVRDMDSGRVFYEKNSNEKKLPASTTKIMTAIIAIENNDLSEIVKVGDEILTIDGSNIYIEMGEHILLLDLLYGMLLRSGNDSAMSLSKYTSSSVNNFVSLMNKKAYELGLNNTSFANPTGLDDNEENYTTMNELSKIYSYAYKNKTFREIIGTKKYSASSDKKSYLFNNRSKILFMYDKCTGAKTGYTPKAGRLLVSSAYNGDLNLVIASSGNTYGYDIHIKYFEYVFSKYKNYLILDKDHFYIKTNLDGKLFIKNSFSYPVTKEEKDLIKKTITYNKNKKGYVGDIKIYLDDKVIHKEKVYLKENKKSFFDKLISIFK